MILIMKKTNVILGILIFVLAAAIIAINVGFSNAEQGKELGKPAYVETLSTTGKIVVLDAGHGGIDGGVVGAHGTVESDINLKITKILRHYLQEKGYKVVLTRKSTDGLYEIGTKSKKLSDMQKRKEIIDEMSACLILQSYLDREKNKKRELNE